MAFGTTQSQPYAQIFVDGQTSYLKEGWKICLQDSIQPITFLESNKVFSESEIVYTTGVLTLGHLNAALGGFEVLIGTTAEHTDVLLKVTPNMQKRYIPGSREAFILIGVVMAVFFFLMALWILLASYFGHQARQENAANKNEDINELRDLVTVPQVLITTVGNLQIQLMILISWAFPKSYYETLRPWLWVLSFDLFLFRIPVFINPVVQFLGASLFVI